MFQQRVLALAALCIVPAIAQAQTYIGAGGISCSNYVSATGSTRDLLQGYAQGYTSGMSAAAYVYSRRDVLSGVSPGDVISYTQAYCRAHPAKTLLNATNDYINMIAAQ